MKRAFVQPIVVKLMHFFFELQFEGLEHIPDNGGLIIATNHISRLDLPTLICIEKRPDITALVATKYKRYPFFRWLIEVGEGIWLDRTKADFSAFKEAEDLLKNGGTLGIAPEGTRSRNGKLQRGKPGTVLIAAKTGIPIIPVGITGTDVAFKKRIVSFKRPVITIRFGEKYTLPSINGNNDRSTLLREYTDDLMCRIAALLPEDRRGVYANEERLRELV
jgi:1-acyl-sn-glycerol-3-phosphate acyltransferase